MRKDAALPLLAFAALLAAAPASAQDTPPPARMPATMAPASPMPADFVQGKAEFDKGNFNGAYLLLLPYAQRGNAEAQFLMGRMSDEGGGGIALDPREAVRWYRLSAAKEYPKALYALAKAAAIGRGMAQSPGQALDFLRRAAEVDFTPAILDMASLYDDGRGVDADRGAAFGWYMRGAELGNTEARFMVGERLYNGDGVSQNRDDARRWYTLAAGRGHPGALFRLAQIGFGRPLNTDLRITTYAWLTLAQQRGGPEIRKEATELRTKLAATMIQVDIDAATARARAWKPEPPLKGEPVDPEDPFNDPEKMRSGR